MSPKQNPDDDHLNSCDDLAREWNCHPYTVRRKIWSGELKAVRLGPRCVRVTNAEKRRYLASLQSAWRASNGGEAA